MAVSVGQMDSSQERASAFPHQQHIELEAPEDIKGGIGTGAGLNQAMAPRVLCHICPGNRGFSGTEIPWIQC